MRIKKVNQSIGIVGTVSEDITDTNNNAVPTCETVKEYVDEKHTYSTTETVIGTWIDGKPIYRKVIDIGTLPNSTSKLVSAGTSNIEYVSKIYGTANAGNGFISLPDTYPNAPIYDTRILFDKSTNDITIMTAFDRSNYSGYVILEYTKTTD